MQIHWPLQIGWTLQINWPLLLTVLLVLMKQLYKLFVYHKPDKVDFIKALVALPLDISFLVVGLIIKAAMSPQPFNEHIIVYICIYTMLCLLSTALWRICDNEAKNGLGKVFRWAFPLNAALSGVIFYVAIEILE